MILQLSSLNQDMHPLVKLYNIVTGSHLIHGHKKTLLPTQSGVWIFTIYLCIPQVTCTWLSVLNKLLIVKTFTRN